MSGSTALLLTVLVRVSSSSDPTTSMSPRLVLVVWLSEEEIEDVEDMRDLASRLSRTCRKRPLLMAASLLLFPWTVSDGKHCQRSHFAAKTFDISVLFPVSIPGSVEVSTPSSPPELKKTSKASWSEMSISSIWSSKSTFTSIDEMLPMGAAGKEEDRKLSAS